MPLSNCQECKYDENSYWVPTMVIKGTRCVLMSKIENYISGTFQVEHDGHPIPLITLNHEIAHPRRIKYQPDCVLTIVNTPRIATPATIIGNSDYSSIDQVKEEPDMVVVKNRIRQSVDYKALSPNAQGSIMVAVDKFLTMKRLSKVNENGVINAGAPIVNNGSTGDFPECMMSPGNKEMIEILAKIQEVIEQNKKTHHQNEKIHEQNGQTHQRLALLDKKMTALLTQSYELHEYPIPRMFIILPVDVHPVNPAAIFTTKYRLYFLCECGEHTESQTAYRGSKHAVHIALHKGYDISKPKEFYAKYGPYMLYLLRALRFGLQVAGVSIPAFSKNSESDNGLDSLIDITQKTLDASITFLDTELSNITALRNDENGQEIDVSGEERLRHLEALEGADLRQLEMFIKRNDRDKVLGNLYRITTEKGHVKWVCLSHYRINYQEVAENQFRNIIHVQGGDYDEHYGKVVLTLTSAILVKEFSAALVQAKQLQELDITFIYKWQASDLKVLADAIHMTTIRSLALDVSNRDFGGFNQRASALRNIMSNKQLQTIKLKVDDWFIERGLMSIKDLSHVKVLEFGNYSFGSDRERHWIQSMQAITSACPLLERIKFKNITISRNGALSLNILFDRCGLLVHEYDRSNISVSRQDILIEAGLSVIEEMTELQIRNNAHIIDVLERQARDGDFRLEKLGLTCGRGLSDLEVGKIAKFMRRLKLTYLELSIGDCNVLPILKRVDYSLLTTFKLRGTINETIWEALDDTLKEDSMVKELTLSNTSDIYTDKGMLSGIISRIAFKSLYIHNCRGITGEEWARILSTMDLSQLSFLYISCTQFGDAAVSSLIHRLSEAESLSHLILLDTQITTSSFKNLKTVLNQTHPNIIYEF
ncbi:hypothetical protein K7432_004050 [Basidiobolus ranarum]|uniref:RNI-like protein n=1 Tax=Basidiobolus ranarum TaxID=34480 RepID=A0ABR2WYU6_9FUNG